MGFSGGQLNLYPHKTKSAYLPLAIFKSKRFGKCSCRNNTSDNGVGFCAKQDKISMNIMINVIFNLWILCIIIKMDKQNLYKEKTSYLTYYNSKA